MRRTTAGRLGAGLAALAFAGLAALPAAAAPSPIRHRTTVSLGEVTVPDLVYVDAHDHLAYTSTGGEVVVTHLKSGRALGVPISDTDDVSHLLLDQANHELVAVMDSEIVRLRGTKIVSTLALAAGTFFEAPTLDAANGLLYMLVDDQAGAQLLVYDGSRLVASYDAGSAANEDGGPPVVDTKTGLVYAPLKADSQVAVLNDAALVTRITVSQYPDLIRIDQRRGIVYDLSVVGQLDVIKSGEVAASFATHARPLDQGNELLDPTSGDLYVTGGTSSGRSGVSVFNGTNRLGFVATKAAVGALDPSRNQLYLPSTAGMEVLHGTTVAARPKVIGVTGATSFLNSAAGVRDATDDLMLLNLSHSVVAMRNSKVKQRVKVGRDPSDEGFDHALHLAVIVNNQSSTLSLLTIEKSAAPR